MKPIPIIWCLLALPAFVGRTQLAAQEDAPPSTMRERAITVGSRQSLWLQVFADGSGTVGYGEGGSYQGWFKDHTSATIRCDALLVVRDLGMD